jgi:release factor glutamine methyltransferase
MKQEHIYNSLLQLLVKDLMILPDKDEETPDNTLRALWHFANSQRLSPIKAEKLHLPELTISQINVLEESVKQRISGVPLAHITERQHFLGLDYIVNKGLYIPRKETELLAKTAIETIQNDFQPNRELKLIDLCTGIGTVALAVAYYCKNIEVYGSDIYKPAIDAAKVNADYFHLSDRSKFYHADLFEPFKNLNLKDSIEVIVSAPPYISSVKVKQMASEIADHEPEEAFDAGPFGLSVFNQIIADSPGYLRNNGYLIFECGLGQGEFLVNRLRKNKQYGDIKLINDENGNGRVIKAKKVC